MTNDEKIQWLRGYRMAVREVERLRDEIERWQSIAEKVTPTLSPVRYTVSDGNRVETAIEKIETLRSKLAEALSSLVDRCAVTEQAINSVPDERLRLLLRYRYIDGMTLECAAEKLGLSNRHTKRLHKKGVDVLVCPVWSTL